MRQSPPPDYYSRLAAAAADAAAALRHAPLPADPVLAERARCVRALREASARYRAEAARAYGRSEGDWATREAHGAATALAALADQLARTLVEDR
jgi:hypothetical protein